MHHSTIKIKPVSLVKSCKVQSIDFGIENNDKDPDFKVVDLARISKYKNIFVKGHVPNFLEEAFVIKKVKSTVPWTYVLSGLTGE